LAELRFSVLGPVRAWRDGEEIDIGSPQRRVVLAILLVHAGRPASLGEIVDVLWGEDPPASAVNVIHRHIGTLRRLLEPGLSPREAGRWLARAGGGYRLAVGADAVDLLRFRFLVTQARREAGDEAARLAAEALALWQGPCADGIDPQARTHPVFAALDREYLSVARAAADLALAAGQPEIALGAVQRAAADAPLDESLQARLVQLLTAANRRAEAIAIYQRVRLHLADELGLDPGPELRAAHEQVLRPAAVQPPPDRPAQLPADLSTFTGRRNELAQTLTLLSGSGPANTVVISAIGGMAGIGKTTLAVHWAHQVADQYPDGQLYVNLRGFAASGQVMQPSDALRGFLGALGVPVQAIPVDLDAQSALFRSRLAGRQVLVLLDNARDVEQVRPLLPGSPGCAVIVTSRNQLSGLVAAEGAHSLTLDLLPAAESRDFLARRLGGDRIAAEPQAVAEILDRCAGLPLALAVVAARTTMRPEYSLKMVANELTAAHGSLDAFSRTDASSDVRAVFSWSYHAVGSAAARLFRLLPTHPGPDIPTAAAAALAGLPGREVTTLLGELARAHLVGEPKPGRYSCHDLLNAYAAELAEPDESRAALHRVLDYYLHSARAAALALFPQRPLIPLAEPQPDVTPAQFPDRDAAMAWFTAEHANLTAAISAAVTDFDAHAWQLAWTMENYLEWQGHWADWTHALRASVAAGERLGDPFAQANAHRGLGLAYAAQHQNELADHHLAQALQFYDQIGDLVGQGAVQRAIAAQLMRQHRFVDALRLLEHALDRYQRAEFDNGAGAALNEIGWCHTIIGNHERAIQHCTQAMAILQRAGNRPGEAATWDSLGYAHHQLGDHAEAARCYQRAVDLRREDGARQHEARSLTRLGDVHHDAGDHQAATAAWRRAADILTDLRNPDVANVLTRLDATRPDPG